MIYYFIACVKQYYWSNKNSHHDPFLDEIKHFKPLICLGRGKERRGDEEDGKRSPVALDYNLPWVTWQVFVDEMLRVWLQKLLQKLCRNNMQGTDGGLHARHPWTNGFNTAHHSQTVNSLPMTGSCHRERVICSQFQNRHCYYMNQ